MKAKFENKKHVKLLNLCKRHQGAYFSTRKWTITHWVHSGGGHLLILCNAYIEFLKIFLRSSTANGDFFIWFILASKDKPLRSPSTKSQWRVPFIQFIWRKILIEIHHSIYLFILFLFLSLDSIHEYLIWINQFTDIKRERRDI